MSTTEELFNEGLAGSLRRCLPEWDQPDVVVAEQTGLLASSLRKKVDILVSDPYLPPVCLEVEIDPPAGQSNPAEDAIRRLGEQLSPEAGAYANQYVNTSIAVRAPFAVRNLKTFQERRDALLGGTPLFYKACYQDDEEGYITYPREGYINGTVRELSEFIKLAAIPTEEMRRTSDKIINAVQSAATKISRAINDEGERRRIAEVLARKDPDGALRVAAVVWLNAFLMQNKLASALPEHVLSVQQMKDQEGDGILRNRNIRKVWVDIQRINYRSIYDPALGALPRNINTYILMDSLQNIIEAVEDTETTNLDKVINVGGDLFARMIVDRKETASFYTLPEVAELLAYLTIPADVSPANGSWDKVRLGDFACGTGTLLRAGYRRISALANNKSLHKWLITEGIAGFDITPIAAHLTATALASFEPAQSYYTTNIGVVPIGMDGRTGSLELLNDYMLENLFGSGTKASLGKKDDDEEDKITAATGLTAMNGSFDFILMNPPYSRTRGGQSAFDIEGVSPEERKLCQARAGKLRKNTPANGQAGLGSDFAVIADLKLADHGRVGLVLPMTAASASSWRQVREMFEKQYSDLTTVSYAGGARGGKEAMSADTHQGEMLLIAQKGLKGRAGIASVVIDHPVRSLAEAAETARVITKSLRGSQPGQEGILRVGEDEVGRWRVQSVSCEGDSWGAVGAQSLELTDIISELLRGKFGPQKVKMTTIGELFTVGPTHHLIGHMVGKEPIGAFEFHSIKGSASPRRGDRALWSSGRKYQDNQTINVSPTHYGIVYDSDKADGIRESVSDLLLQRNMRWTSQPALAAYAEKPVLGGRGWITLQHSNNLVKLGFALWANSTLGMATYWYHGGRQHSGRTQIQVTSIAALPCPDFQHYINKLDKDRLNDFSDFDLDLANRADRDQNRAKFDKLISEILNIDYDKIRQLAGMWVAEPSVKG